MGPGIQEIEVWDATPALDVATPKIPSTSEQFDSPDPATARPPLAVKAGFGSSPIC